MKIWIKLLAGTLLGVLLSFLLPLDKKTWQDIFLFFSEFTIRIVRYVSFPLFFFTLATGVHELHREKQTLSVMLRLVIYLAASAFLLVFLGMLVTFVIGTP